jgi:hypothetical protein
MGRFTNLNPSPTPLSQGMDLPTNRLPEPQWIEVSREEYNRIMQCPVKNPILHVSINEEVSYSSLTLSILSLSKSFQMVEKA